MLTIDGGLPAFSKFCSAMSPPNVEVSAQDANSIAAFGAAALEYSASRMASPSSPFIPGFVQLFAKFGCTCVKLPPLYPESPNVERNVLQSAVENTLVSSITTIVCP